MIPKQLEGMRFNRVKFKDKRAFEIGWQKKPYNYDEIQKYFPNDNYGIICGEEIRVLDDDTPKKGLITLFLEKFGETFRVRDHLYFKFDNGHSKKIIFNSYGGVKFDDGKGGKTTHMGELQGEGTYVVGPGCIHPSGEVYEQKNDLDIITISYDEFVEVFGEYIISKATQTKNVYVKGVGLVETEQEDEFIKNVKEKWNVGDRQELAMSVAGYLRKNKRLGLDSALSIVEGIARDCEDEEVNQRLAAVRATYNKDESEIKGISGLKDMRVETEEGEILELDVNGRSISDLCEDSAKLLSDKNILFYRPMARKIVEVGDVKINATGNNMLSSFLEMGDKRFITLVEKFAKVGWWKTSKFGDMFNIKSLSPVKASIILNSHILEESLPQITRIFSSPIPIVFEDKITFPKVGYDKRFNSWRNSNSVDILSEDMSLDEAKEIIKKMYSEFCFKGEQDRINSIAALITPFSRGMFNKFNTNTPANLYLGNREGVGKDYCAAIPGLVIDGQFQQDAPISNGGKVDDDELRKKITSAVRSGRVRMHFANNKGYLNSGILEKLLTDPYWTDRILSKNEEIIYPNELDVSLSGNIPIRYTDDLERRLVFINLFYSQENINEREFRKTDLHGWILKNRSKILTALYCIVKDWFDNGRKNGTVAFSSFPEWANVVGGIMENAGYGSPCIRDDSNKILTGDSDSDEIKELFTLCYERYKDRPVQKSDIITVIKESEDLFSYVDWGNKGDQTRFSIKLRKYLGREFNNISMNIKDISVRSVRQQFIFNKRSNEVGHVGHVGHGVGSVPIESKNLYTPVRRCPMVTEVTKHNNPTTGLSLKTIKTTEVSSSSPYETEVSNE